MFILVFYSNSICSHGGFRILDNKLCKDSQWYFKSLACKIQKLIILDNPFKRIYHTSNLGKWLESEFVWLP